MNDDKSLKDTFHAARDGEETPKPSTKLPTMSQQKALDDLKTELDKPIADPLKLKSVLSRLDFNTKAHEHSRETTQHQPPKPESYTSEFDGKTYTSPEAIEAAKKIDAKQTGKKPVVSEHPAPAPKPKSAPASKNRGKSSQPTNAKDTYLKDDASNQFEEETNLDRLKRLAEQHRTYSAKGEQRKNGKDDRGR